MGKWGKFEDYKKWVLKFDFLLVFGLLVHSIIFLVINRTISPSEIIGSNIEIVRDRLFWRQIAEALVGVCGISFCSSSKSVTRVPRPSVCDGVFILNEGEVPITIQSVKLWFPQSSVTCLVSCR